MRLIIEGPDGVGKTTLTRALADHFGCDILVMTRKGSKKKEDYVWKAGLNNVISDRSFLSEMVYSKVFDRESRLTTNDYEELIKFYRNNGWIILLLDADTSVIKQRLEDRGDEDEENIQNIAKLRMIYRACSYFYNLPILNSENLDIDQLIKNLEAGKYESNCGQ